MEINYNTVYIEDSDEDYGKHLTPETLIVSFGGDGTALKAMKTSWSNDLLFMPLGTGRVGYLVNQSGDIHDVLKSWINEDNEIVKRSAVIQNSEKDLPAFNEANSAAYLFLMKDKNSISNSFTLATGTLDIKFLVPQ